MRFSSSLCSVAAIGLALSACNSVDFKKTKTGLPYKVFSSAKGDSVNPGSIIKFSYQQMLNDSVIFPQKDQPVTPFYLQVEPQGQPYDVSEVLPTLKEGDSVYAVQLVDTFLARSAGNQQAQQLPAQFKKGGKIITTLKVLQVFANAQEAQADEAKTRQSAFLNDKKIQQQLATDDQALKAYLAQNNISAQKVGLGTYVQVLQPGAGPKVENGKFVSLMYKGQTLAGKVFDTNMDNSFNHTDPLSFVVGGSPMIKGFEEGILGLSKGSKVRLFIPSPLAYGPQPPSPDIKPNENLVFDIEVSDIANQPPAPSMQAAPGGDATRR
jgi:FKBP-type peptidyl-prolyl cis-trans isomerase FkpA